MLRFSFDRPRRATSTASSWRRICLGAWLCVIGAAAFAQQNPNPDLGPCIGPCIGPRVGPGNGKLLLTGGVSSIDGAAGGGLTPWALIGSYAAENEVGATAFFTRVVTRDYGLNIVGVAVGIADRYEISYARQSLNASAAVPGTVPRQDIVGVKLRVAGDAVLDADTWWPQIAIGAEFKQAHPGSVIGGMLNAVGAKRFGVDLYVSASKLLLAQSVLVSATLRATKANQNGLLGFGSVEQHDYRLEPEASIAWMLRRNVAVGAEYRFKPDNLRFAGEAFRENAWRDIFVAWAPNKLVSLTAAFVDLGNIVGHAHQTGGYLSAQLAY